MNSFVMFAVFALAAVATAEPPSGYNYRQPSSGGGHSSGGGGYASSSGGYASSSGFSSGGSAFGGSSNYVQESIGQNTQEGLNVDPQLLEKIRNILLQEESKASSGGSQGGFGGGFGGGPSSQYGPPKPQYGPPSSGGSSRVVGIVLENTIPSIQVAQYRADGGSSSGGYSSGSSSGGYSSGPSFSAPSSSYGAPAPSAPSSSYGAPQQQQQRPSSNYGAPF